MSCVTEHQREALASYVDARVSVEPNSGCWLWLLSDGSHGYPQGSMPAVMQQPVSLAHRMSYIAANGEIPKGYDIDHLCRVRCCVNPDHLEATTQLANRSRQFGIDCAADHVAADGCPKGHGPYRIRSGRKFCLQCGRDRDAKYRAKKAAQAAATASAAPKQATPATAGT